jgi:hypothetical protein
VKNLLGVAAALAVVLGIPSEAWATHFRSGNIRWDIPDPATPRKVRFTVTVAWRSAYQPTDCTTLNFGDNTNNGCQVGQSVGSGVSSNGESYTLYRYEALHTYAADGDFTAFFSSCCRSSSLANAADNSFQVSARVNVGASGVSGGVRMAALPVMHVQTGGVRTFVLPAADPDGAPISCRFATPTEAGDSATTMPPVIPATSKAPTLSVSISPPGCLFTWDTTGATAGQTFAVNVVAESSKGGRQNNTMVDFIVEMVASPVPTCTGGGRFTAYIGDDLHTDVVGTNTSGGAMLVVGGLLDVGSINPPAGTAIASPGTIRHHFEPQPEHQGVQIALISVVDSGNRVGSCPLVFDVPACPDYGTACTVGVGACERSGIVTCASGASACNAVAGSPSAEVCDNLDNDCDGVTDNGLTDINKSCDTSLLGVCGAGSTTCEAGGVLACTPHVAVGTVTETCNDLDDDCDGSTDEGFNVGVACSSGVGACQRSGVIACDAQGGAMCDAVPGNPSIELCNGVDDDCDGAVDQGNPESGASCPTTLPGACSVGLTSCQSSEVVCVPVRQPDQVAEWCNGVDDDCDAETDEGFNVGATCVNGIGACERSGLIVCNEQGGASCDAVPGIPDAERCDGLDNNCDGSTDEGFDLGSACTNGVGACQRSGALVCNDQGEAVCDAEPAAPGVELCDGLDNNCDGATDEGDPEGGTACTTDLPGVCAAGVTSCRSGALACVASTQPGAVAEICNGLDDDCDGTVDEDACASATKTPSAGCGCTGSPGALLSLLPLWFLRRRRARTISAGL